MHEKLIRQLSSQVADALVERELACTPNRRAALALLKTHLVRAGRGDQVV